MNRRSIAPGVRLISAFLIVGGIAGIAAVLWAETGALILSDLIFLGFALLVFGASVWVGADLWKGKPQSYKWAQLLFLFQIPTVSFHGFAFQFYLALVLGLSFSREAASRLNIEFELGSSLNVKISPQIESLVVGVNMVAIAALIYLIKKEREVQ